MSCCIFLAVSDPIPPGFMVVRFLPVAQDIRRALSETVSVCRDLLDDGRDDILANLQIVLAEALNNVAEHAFAGLKPQEGCISARLGGSQLHVTIVDRGRPLPGNRIPPARHHDLSQAGSDLPEGGFGWMLIHELTSQIAYERREGENRLRLSFDLDRAR